MRFLLIFYMLFFLSGCVKKCKGYDEYEERISNEIIHKAAMQIKKEKNLIPCGTGGGGAGGLRMLYLAFDYYNEIEIEEARSLLIEAGNLFLKTINEDERIRPYLSNFPFEPKNIEMTIFFKKSHRSSVGSNKLCLVALGDGKIRYEIRDPKTNFLETILTETYEEAQEKVHVQPAQDWRPAFG